MATGDSRTADPKLEADLAYFGDDANFCPDCGREWPRCECEYDPYDAICESRFGPPGNVNG